MKKLLLLSLIAGASVAFAQPVLTTTMIPSVGQVMNYHKAAYMSPGSSGANQTWNFSTLTSTGTTNYTVGLPSSTQYTASFPNANLQMNDGTNYEFWSTTANDLSVEGVVDGLGT